MVEIRSKGRKLVFEVNTYERFTNRALYRQGFYVLIDSRDDASSDFKVWLTGYKNGYEFGVEQEGVFPHCRVLDRNGKTIAHADGYRDRRSMRCSLPRKVFEPTRHLRWRATSSSEGQRDLAPQTGWYRH